MNKNALRFTLLGRLHACYKLNHFRRRFFKTFPDNDFLPMNIFDIKLFSSGKYSYGELNILSFKDNYKLEVLKVNDLSNLSENDRKNNRDYISVMNDNIDLLRKEIYNN